MGAYMEKDYLSGIFFELNIVKIAIDSITILYFFSILNMKVKVKKTSPYACILQKATLGSACCDLYSERFVLLEPGKTKKIETDIGFKFSFKFACRI